MKGVVFNLFEDFVCEHWGADAYEALLEACPLQTSEPFVGPGTYADEDLMMLLHEACQRFDLEPRVALHRFGRFLLPKLAAKVPSLLDHSDARSFLRSVHDVVHMEVHKLYIDAATPTFRYADRADGGLVIEYQSPRRLCHLMEGLLHGVAATFHTRIDAAQTSCMHDGAAHCTFELTFTPMVPA